MMFCIVQSEKGLYPLLLIIPDVLDETMNIDYDLAAPRNGINLDAEALIVSASHFPVELDDYISKKIIVSLQLDQVTKLCIYNQCYY